MMRHLLKMQLLDALRDSLHDVENLKLIPEDDPQVAVIRNDLRNTITQMCIREESVHYLEMLDVPAERRAT